MPLSRLSVFLGSVLVLLAPRTASAADASSRYEVRAGDSLWSIAQASGCSIEQLRRANGVRGDLIRIGDSLTLPRCGTALTRHYRVKLGDTLSHIALRNSTTVRELQRANDLGTSTLIKVGDALVLPGGGTSPGVPESKGSSSIGKAWRGRLAGGVQLPHDRNYYRRSTRHAYGTAETIAQVQSTLARVRAKHPRVHRLAVGDLSHRHGGPLAGHRSHQSGRDVDLGLYFERVPPGYPDRFVEHDEGRLALGPMWTLIETLARAARQPNGPQYVFLDYALQKRIYRYARKKGVSKTRLRPIFQYPDGRGAADRLVRHEPHHGDHLHVRFRCPRGDRQCE